MSAYPTTSGPSSDMDPRTADLIEATRELLSISRRIAPDTTTHGVHHKPNVVRVLECLTAGEVDSNYGCQLVNEVLEQEGIK